MADPPTSGPPTSEPTSRHPDYTRWPVVEGYPDRQSCEAGQPVPLRCASRSERFSVTVTRIGASAERMWSTDGVVGHDHPVPDRAWEHGCGWPVSVVVPTETSWPSGFYEVALEASVPEASSAPAEDDDRRRHRSEAFFALRPAPTAEAGDVLVVLATNTWNAYNQWGGRCLYSGANRVSFDRPLERGYVRRSATTDGPSGVPYDGRVADLETPPDPEHRRLVAYQAAGAWPLWTASAGWHTYERRFVRWAETRGHRVDVATNLDLEQHPELLDRYHLVVTAGHDEYWSWGMRDTMDRWVASGGNWLILSGNTSFWQVRVADDGRTMICHKGRARTDDPARSTDPSRLTSMWSDPWIGRPETSTTGLTFTRGGYHRVGQAVVGGSGAYTVHRPDHWAFAGTGLAGGDLLGDGSFIVGYEVDGCDFTVLDGPGGPRPVPTGRDGAPDGLEILATAPARLISITDERCEAPVALWASVDPPGDLEGVAMVLHDTATPTARQVDEFAAGHAVMAVFGRGDGMVFNAGTTGWVHGLDRDPLVQRVTANVIDHLTSR